MATDHPSKRRRTTASQQPELKMSQLVQAAIETRCVMPTIYSFLDTSDISKFTHTYYPSYDYTIEVATKLGFNEKDPIYRSKENQVTKYDEVHFLVTTRPRGAENTVRKFKSFEAAVDFAKSVPTVIGWDDWEEEQVRVNPVDIIIDINGQRAVVGELTGDEDDEIWTIMYTHGYGNYVNWEHYPHGMSGAIFDTRQEAEEHETGFWLPDPVEIGCMLMDNGYSSIYWTLSCEGSIFFAPSHIPKNCQRNNLLY
jgi:hypothetical protein